MGDGAAPVTVILPAVIMMHIAACTLGCVTPGCREFGRLARQESLFRDLLDRVASISAVTHLDAVVVVRGAPEVPHLGRARLLALSRVLPPQCQRNQRRGGDYDYRKQPLTAPTWHGTARVLSCAEDIRSGIALLSSRGIFQAMGSSTPIMLVSPNLIYTVNCTYPIETIITPALTRFISTHPLISVRLQLADWDMLIECSRASAVATPVTRVTRWFGQREGLLSQFATTALENVDRQFHALRCSVKDFVGWWPWRRSAVSRDA